MKLIETYALSCGLRIDKPHLIEKFYPLTEGKYLTIQAGSGQQAKNYDHFNEVMDLLLPFLKAHQISVIQLGAKEDPPIKHCRSLLGQTSLGQAASIVRGSELHFGLDSWLAHWAGAIGRPLVSLYGNTSAREHGPYWQSDKTKLIEAHRNGRKPTFSAEWPKSINTIPPEEIANSVLHFLGLSETISQRTLFIGQIYHQTVLEYIPNFPFDPRVAPNQGVTARLDYGGEEQHIFNGLANGAKFNIVTNRPMTLAALKQLKHNILGLTHEVFPDTDLEYIKELTRLGLKLRIISRESDEAKIADLRMRFFDYVRVEYVGAAKKESFLTDADAYLNSTLDRETKWDTLQYRSNKFLLSNGKIYASKAGWKADKPIASFEANTQGVFDTPEFWEEYQHFRIYA